MKMQTPQNQYETSGSQTIPSAVYNGVNYPYPNSNYQDTIQNGFHSGDTVRYDSGYFNNYSGVSEQNNFDYHQAVGNQYPTQTTPYNFNYANGYASSQPSTPFIPQSILPRIENHPENPSNQGQDGSYQGVPPATSNLLNYASNYTYGEPSYSFSCTSSLPAMKECNFPNDFQQDRFDKIVEKDTNNSFTQQASNDSQPINDKVQQLEAISSNDDYENLAGKYGLQSSVISVHRNGSNNTHRNLLEDKSEGVIKNYSQHILNHENTKNITNKSICKLMSTDEKDAIANSSDQIQANPTLQNTQADSVSVTFQPVVKEDQTINSNQISEISKCPLDAQNISQCNKLVCEKINENRPFPTFQNNLDSENNKTMQCEPMIPQSADSISSDNILKGETISMNSEETFCPTKVEEPQSALESQEEVGIKADNMPDVSPTNNNPYVVDRIKTDGIKNTFNLTSPYSKSALKSSDVDVGSSSVIPSPSLENPSIWSHNLMTSITPSPNYPSSSSPSLSPTEQSFNKLSKANQNLQLPNIQKQNIGRFGKEYAAHSSKIPSKLSSRRLRKKWSNKSHLYGQVAHPTAIWTTLLAQYIQEYSKIVPNLMQQTQNHFLTPHLPVSPPSSEDIWKPPSLISDDKANLPADNSPKEEANSSLILNQQPLSTDQAMEVVNPEERTTQIRNTGFSNTSQATLDVERKTGEPGEYY